MNALRARHLTEAFRSALDAGASEAEALERVAAAGVAYDKRVRWAPGAPLPKARIEAILATVAAAFGTKPDRFTARFWLTREMSGARWIAARLLVDAGMSMREVAPILGFTDHTGVSRSLSRLLLRPDLVEHLEAIRGRTTATVVAVAA